MEADVGLQKLKLKLKHECSSSYYSPELCLAFSVFLDCVSAVVVEHDAIMMMRSRTTQEEEVVQWQKCDMSLQKMGKQKHTLTSKSKDVT